MVRGPHRRRRKATKGAATRTKLASLGRDFKGVRDLETLPSQGSNSSTPLPGTSSFVLLLVHNNFRMNKRFGILEIYFATSVRLWTIKKARAPPSGRSLLFQGNPRGVGP